jgi:hypothetical protein
MARPPARLITTTAVNELQHIDILEASSLYAVLYQQQPFNMKSRYTTVHGEFKKYIRTVFPNKKAAENLAKKLNNNFNCSDFSVTKAM